VIGLIFAVAGLAIFLLLGLGHAAVTAQSTPNGGPMMPTDPATQVAMQKSGGIGLAPEIDNTLYNAWIGFNYSHSLGVAGLAGLLLVHVLIDFEATVRETWFLGFVITVPAIYFALAVNYWFDKPRQGIAMGAVLLWVGVAIELI